MLYIEFLDDSAEGAGSFSFSDYPWSSCLLPCSFLGFLLIQPPFWECTAPLAASWQSVSAELVSQFYCRAGPDLSFTLTPNARAKPIDWVEEKRSCHVTASRHSHTFPFSFWTWNSKLKIQPKIQSVFSSGAGVSQISNTPDNDSLWACPGSVLLVLLCSRFAAILLKSGPDLTAVALQQRWYFGYW